MTFSALAIFQDVFRVESKRAAAKQRKAISSTVLFTVNVHSVFNVDELKSLINVV